MLTTIDWLILWPFQIFRLKAGLLADFHKKELAELELKHKNEMDDLRIQTSKIATAMKADVWVLVLVFVCVCVLKSLVNHSYKSQ